MSTQVTHVRSFYVKPISVNDKVPKSVWLGMMGPTDTIAVTEVRRFDTSNASDLGTVITGADSITQNVLMIATIWNAASDPPSAGTFRLRAICDDTSASPEIKAEINLYYTVLP